MADFPQARTSYIDNTMTNESSVPKLKNGVKIGEGDGTVSLLSLGAMCVEGWKRKRWNPGGVQIITHEVRSTASDNLDLTCPSFSLGSS